MNILFLLNEFPADVGETVATYYFINLVDFMETVFGVVLFFCQSLMYLYMMSCQRRLQWVVQVGAKRGLRKPTTDDVEHAKVVFDD